MSQHLVVLLLGSNLGDSKRNIDEAIDYLQSEIGQVTEKSEYLLSNAVEFESCNIFCNIALRVVTNFSPFTLLHKLKEIERKLGRKVDSAASGGYSDRIIDIDIVFYDALIYKSKKLIIPHHKNANERDFSIKLIAQLKEI